MKLIPLTKGYFAKVDDDDFEWLSQWKWKSVVCKNTVYAARVYVDESGKNRVALMHRQILGIKDRKIEVDHRFGDGLDNTRENIRPCTRSQNSMNRSGFVGSSKYKGVYWSKNKRSWVAQITLNKKLKVIGFFENEENAARAYNGSAKLMHGDFAKYNDVLPMFLDASFCEKQKRRNKKSGFMGVSFYKKMGKWVAEVNTGGIRVYAGRFNTPDEAARAYDAKAFEMFGESAKLNFTRPL